MINQLRDKGVMGQKVSPGGGKKWLDSLYTVKKESTGFFDKLDVAREGKSRCKNHTLLIVTPFFSIDVQMVQEQLDVTTRVTHARLSPPWAE